MRAYKFRLYPTNEQETALLQTFEHCRYVYNTLLDWLKKQDNPNRYELQNRLPKLKEKRPELKNVHSKALQYEVYRLFSNMRALSQSKKKGRKIGYLRYKTSQRFRTIHYNQSGFKIIETNKRLDCLHISKVGDIPMHMHRPVEGSIKQVVIKQYRSGKWYACIMADQQKDIVKQSVKKTVGIDMGIKFFLSDSDGRQFENPKFLEKSLKELRKRQRKLSKCKKGSKNCEKKRRFVARQHEYIENQRNDFLHKLACFYVEHYDIICVEDLNIKGMIRSCFARCISDASWNKFIKLLSYKAESAGKTVVYVNPRGTSQEYKFGEDLDRDYNASLNILERGVRQVVGLGWSEFTPLEIVPPPKLKTVLASTVVELGSDM